MASERGPQHVSQALAELFALRGYARRQGDAQLQAVWDEIAGAEIALYTKVVGVSRGVLRIGVANAAALGELTGFHKPGLLRRLQQQYPELRIRELKFRLDSGIDRRPKP